MTDRPLVLVVEDEVPIRRFLRAALTSHGYRIAEVDTGRKAVISITSQPPDLVILDLGLPDMDGLQLLDEVRAWSQVPFVVLSARDQEREKVDALDRGADDYLTKPFGMEELLARLRVALRNRARLAASASEESARFQSGDLRVDLAARQVFVREEEVHLTPTEYRLLTALVKHAGKVLTHAALLREVWGPGYAEELHYLRVHMAKLRQKIEAEPARPRLLLTEQGVGYRLRAE
jgi:two-component system, OmpR family, KDP operon response regulator KdpE